MSFLLAITDPAAASATEVVEALAPMGWPAAIVTSVVILVMGALFWKILDEIL